MDDKVFRLARVSWVISMASDDAEVGKGVQAALGGCVPGRDPDESRSEVK